MPESRDRKIPWLRVFVEGAVIVVSILLALAADAWWDGRREAAEERAALAGLQADFEVNLSNLQGLIVLHEAQIALVADLMAMSEEERAAIPRDSTTRYLRAMANPGTFESRDGTLDGLTTSGRLSVISDNVLRQGLVRWRTLLADAEEERDAMYAAGQRVMKRNISLGGPTWGLGPDGTDPVPRLSPLDDGAATDLQDLAKDKELGDLVQYKMFMATRYLGELRDLEVHADRVLNRLAAIRHIETSRD